VSPRSRDAYYSGEDHNANLASHDRPNSMEGDGLLYWWHPWEPKAKLCVQVDLGRLIGSRLHAGMAVVREIVWPR